MPSRCFGCSLLSAVHSWEPGSPFCGLRVAAVCDLGRVFFLGALVSVTGAGGAGVSGSFTPRRLGTGIAN